jgi:hypothetical protein
MLAGKLPAPIAPVDHPDCGGYRETDGTPHTRHQFRWCRKHRPNLGYYHNLALNPAIAQGCCDNRRLLFRNGIDRSLKCQAGLIGAGRNDRGELDLVASAGQRELHGVGACRYRYFAADRSGRPPRGKQARPETTLWDRNPRTSAVELAQTHVHRPAGSWVEVGSEVRPRRRGRYRTRCAARHESRRREACIVVSDRDIVCEQRFTPICVVGVAGASREGPVRRTTNEPGREDLRN